MSSTNSQPTTNNSQVSNSSPSSDSERLRELVADFRCHAIWIYRNNVEAEKTDAAQAALLAFIDEQIDALSSSKARVAELERVSEGACAAIEGEFSHYSHAVQLHCALLRTALQPPTEEPGK